MSQQIREGAITGLFKAPDFLHTEGELVHTGIFSILLAMVLWLYNLL